MFGGVTMPKDVREVLDSIPPFKFLPSDVLDALEFKLHMKTYAPGLYIFRQSQESLNTLFLIVRGSAEVVATNDKGDEAVIGYRGVEEFFGETGLTGEQYTASVRAKEELTCILIPGEIIEQLIGKHINFAGYLTEMLVERMRSLYDEVIHDQIFDSTGQLETPLFRKRISDIMSSPVISCTTEDLITDVAGLMEKNNISAVVVTSGDSNPVGLITLANLVHGVLARSVTDYLAITAGQIMSPQVVSIAADSFYADALMAASRNRVKHLVVTSRGRLVGMVTLADLIKTRAAGNLKIIHDIETQQDIDGLAKIGTEIDTLLNALVAEKAPVPEILMILNEFHERLTRKVVQLCELDMVNRGYPVPPVEYCWVNTGSAGRQEQTIRTDQDNFIIFKDHETESADRIREYFLKLALLVNEGLDRCGFVKCPGNVMASNPQWCKSLGEWEQVVEHWVETVAGDPNALRQITIMMDFKPVYGEKKLADTLWKKVIKFYGQSPAISHYLTQDDLGSRVPVSIWGGFLTEKSGPYKDQLSLKTQACVHIVNCTRIFALKNGITETNTFKRIAELRKKGGLKSDEADFVEAAYETLLMFRIRENLKKVNRGEKADNYINPSHLTRQEREILKNAFTAVARLQKLTSSSFTLFWLVK
ncbi:MAG TPA: nucleotidyltransferase [Desulfotomaculum sp.]|nr:nucleotidyltransferase [Desulfotomaculum sp.]